MGVIFKAIASLALIIVAVVCGMFVLGTWNRLGERWVPFLLSSIVLVSCFWAIVQLWRKREGGDSKLSQQQDFELWLAKKIVDATDLSAEQIAALRDEYDKEFGSR